MKIKLSNVEGRALWSAILAEEIRIYDEDGENMAEASYKTLSDGIHCVYQDNVNGWAIETVERCEMVNYAA